MMRERERERERETGGEEEEALPAGEGVMETSSLQRSSRRCLHRCSLHFHGSRETKTTISRRLSSRHLLVQTEGDRLVGEGPSRGAALVVRGRRGRGKGFGELAELQGKGKKPLVSEEVCPCGNEDNLPYSKCCKKYHQGSLQAETPRRLLQTRFAAYSKGLSRYIVDTAVMPDTDPDELIRDIEASCAKLKFMDLSVLEEAVHDDHAVIKFRYKVKTVGQKGFRQGKAEVIEETSHFIRDQKNGKWFFNEGVTDRSPAQ